MKPERLLLCFALLTGCSMKNEADIILRNAKIYTVDETFSIAEAIAIKDGKILAIGGTRDVLDDYTAARIIDVKAKPIYPGFIDAHCHFVGYGLSLKQVDLTGTKSFENVLARMEEYAAQNSGWITGRGWDQNDWEVKEFPTRTALDSLFPDRPVLIKRIDGHAALANKIALDLANLSIESSVAGGTIEVKDGILTGLLIDNAIDLVLDVIPDPTREEYSAAIQAAEQRCFAVGLTTVDDAGLDLDVVTLLDKMHKEGTLKMKVYAMLNPSKENFGHFGEMGPILKERLTVRSFKFYADGALGSRGAALKQPYSDDPENTGLLLTDVEFLAEKAAIIYAMDFQMNTHCIGDSGNKLILDLYGKVLQGANDKRWRIEHAQIIDFNDISKFGEHSIIPSVQATHCTSDMYWAEDRLGEARMTGAYAYKELMEQNGMIAGGSDFPVEGINPLLGFYAAVERKDLEGYPEGGFQMSNAISRQQALKSMTIWSAIANFEEDAKGTLEVGKDADLVILDTDIMTENLDNIQSIRVLSTFINGEEVYNGGL
ncbi:MAG TPA: amidohydrolase [Flavobacteriales bacterium]|nr:amidohydrolase [Flavobacteriales bacterium]